MSNTNKTLHRRTFLQVMGAAGLTALGANIAKALAIRQTIKGHD